MRLGLIFFLAIIDLGHASYFDECLYKFKVDKLNTDSVSISDVKYISSTGHLSQVTAETVCLSYLKSGKVSKKELLLTWPTLKAGKTYSAKRKYFNSMGPNGLVNSISWRFIGD